MHNCIDCYPRRPSSGGIWQKSVKCHGGGVEVYSSWILIVQEVGDIKVVLQRKIDSNQNRKECSLLYAWTVGLLAAGWFLKVCRASVGC